jgi:hypothetical protein
VSVLVGSTGKGQETSERMTAAAVATTNTVLNKVR